jgi:hypothetical protein
MWNPELLTFIFFLNFIHLHTILSLKIEHLLIVIKVFYLFVNFIFVVLGYELRASYMLSKH